MEVTDAACAWQSCLIGKNKSSLRVESNQNLKPVLSQPLHIHDCSKICTIFKLQNAGKDLFVYKKNSLKKKRDSDLLQFCVFARGDSVRGH